MPNSTKEKNSNYVNKSLDKALSILDLFDSSNYKLTITEIADKFNTNPSSLYSILYTLENHGYLSRDQEKRYSLGMSFPKKGRLVLEQFNLPAKAREELVNLRDEANEAVHLAALNENHLVYIDKVESNRGLKMYSSPGKTAPLHATALGKAMLAHLPEDRLDNILENIALSQETDQSITSKSELKEALSKVRERGYALDDEEFEVGIRCAAGPIHKYDGEVEAAISLTGLAAQIDDEKLNRMGSLVKKYADKISAKLGYEK